MGDGQVMEKFANVYILIVAYIWREEEPRGHEQRRTDASRRPLYNSILWWR